MSEEIINSLVEKVASLSRELGALEEKNRQQAVNVESEKSKSLYKLQELMVMCLTGSKDRIAQLKAVRELTGVGLKEAKDSVQGAYKQAGLEFYTVSTVDRPEDND